jgi:hypothetical protein
MEDDLRTHFCSTYFSEDLSVYHSESEHYGGNGSDATPATLDRGTQRGGHLQPDNMPKQQYLDNDSVSTLIKAQAGNEDSADKSSAFPANITRLTRKRRCYGLDRPQSRTQEAKMIKAALSASLLEA